MDRKNQRIWQENTRTKRNGSKESEGLDGRYPKDESNEPLDLCVRTKLSEDLTKPTCSKETSLSSTADSCAVASPSSSKRPRKRQKKIYLCGVQMCSYSTVQEGHLIRHDRTHKKEKPFSCPQCAKKSTRKWNLWVHFKRLHKELPTPQELQPRPRRDARLQQVWRKIHWKGSIRATRT